MTTGIVVISNRHHCVSNEVRYGQPKEPKGYINSKGI